MAIQTDFGDGTADVNWGRNSVIDNLMNTGFSITARLYMNAYWSSGICNKNESEYGTQGGFKLELLNTGKLQLTVYPSGDWGVWVTDNVVVPETTWKHIAFTYSAASASNDPVFYVDGASVPFTETATPTVTGTPDDSGYRFVSGNDASNGRLLRGQLEDLRMYNRILNAGEVMTIATARGRDAIVHGLVFRGMQIGVTNAALASEKEVSISGLSGAGLAEAPIYVPGVTTQRRRIQKL